MNITIKTTEEQKKMREAGALASEVLRFIAPFVKEGVSTNDLNTLCHDFIISRGGIPSPLFYRGFPKSICTSINNVVCHGIPSETEILQDGDIINIDITVKLNGYHGDTSKTFLVGKVAPHIQELVSRTYEAMWVGIDRVKPGAYFGDIGEAISRYIKPFDYGIVREYTGHGIGKNFHEDPYVLHYASSDPVAKMQPGMVFTIEPMISFGTSDVITSEEDGWTVYTKDSQYSAQFEHTVLVTESGREVLTLREEEK
jgi:methionyl aminopeptidase